jgi:hypothetical protein
MRLYNDDKMRIERDINEVQQAMHNLQETCKKFNINMEVDIVQTRDITEAMKLTGIKIKALIEEDCQ